MLNLKLTTSFLAASMKKMILNRLKQDNFKTCLGFDENAPTHCRHAYMSHLEWLMKQANPKSKSSIVTRFPKVDTSH